MKFTIDSVGRAVSAPVQIPLWRSSRPVEAPGPGRAELHHRLCWYTAQGDISFVFAAGFPVWRMRMRQIINFTSCSFLRRCACRMTPTRLSYRGEVRSCLTNANTAVAMSTFLTRHDPGLLLFTNPTPDR